MGEQNKGYTYESFARRAKTERKRTNYYKKKAQDINLWSYIGEERQGEDVLFRFYKLTLETMKEQKYGLSIPPVVVKRVHISSMNKALELHVQKALAKNGLLVSGIGSDPSRMLGFSDAGIAHLCDRLRIAGRFAAEPSVNRDLLIAEKLIMGAKEGEEYTFAIHEGDNGQAMVTGVFEDRYNGSGFWGMYEAYKGICDASYRFMEMPRLYMWEVYDGKMSVHAEFTDMEAELSEGRSLIPGFRLINSDNGRSSFTMQAVVRPSGTDGLIVISEKKLCHRSSTRPKDAAILWTDGLVKELAEWLVRIKEESREVRKYYKAGTVSSSIKHILLTSGIEKVIGKKRERAWMCIVHDRFKQGKIRTQQDIMWALFTLRDDLPEEYRDLGETNSERLNQALGKARFSA